MMKVVYVALGGAVGAVVRYNVSGWVQNATQGAFPWGTLYVNAGGSLLIGLFWGLTELTPVSPGVRLFFAIGFLGSFTTFSTFSLETFGLLRDRETMLSLMNIGLNNVLALLGVFAGYFFSRYIISLIK
jgi:CrcB protein